MYFGDGFFDTQFRLLWKLPFVVSMSNMRTYLHVTLEFIRIEVRRDRAFAVALSRCRFFTTVKIGSRWLSSGL